MTYRDYNDPLYKKWRKDVRARDGQKCRFPGCTKRRPLHVHHIIKWASAQGLRYSIQNGITLCKTHHNMVNGKEENFASLFYGILVNDNRKRHS